MKINTKIKYLSVLVITFILSACMFVGCNNGGEEELKLNRSEATILIDGTFLLEAKYTLIDDTELVFTVDDLSIVSVSEAGVVKGIKVGTTTVTAKYGKSSASCVVNVVSDGLIPTLEFVYDINDEATCFVGEGINLKANMLFNTIEYTDASVSYTLSDNSVASINSDGQFVALKAGKTSITVKAEWRGFKQQRIIEVTVLDKVECYLNDGSSSLVEIYTVNSSYGEYNYINTKTVQPIAKVNGIEVSCEVKSLDRKVFIVRNNRTVVAVSAGKSQMRIEFSYNDSNYYFDFDVVVLKPVFEAEQTIDLFDATKGIGENSISAIFNNADLSGQTKATALDENGNLTDLIFTVGDGVNSEKLAGVPVNGKEKVAQNITLETSNVIYKVTVIPYTNVITSVDEFVEIFAGGTADEQKLNDGYYILGCDISSSYKSIKHNSKGSDFYDELAGTFDGNGYGIKGIYCQNGGLFGDVTGTIKNVKLDICIDNYRSSQFTLIGKFTSTTSLEDIYLKASSQAKTNANAVINGLACSGMSSIVKMKNVVIDTTALSFKSSNHNGSNDWKHFNPYSTNYDVFSTNSAAKNNLNKLQTNQTNVYFITEQYVSEFSLGSGKPHAIIDAGNKSEGWKYDSEYTGGIAENNIETVFVETFYRYDTALDMKNATKAGTAKDYEAFTKTGFWRWDSTFGLTWKNNTITLTTNEATINIDETVALDVNSDTLDKSCLEFSVEDSSVAIVDNQGVVRGVKPGVTVVNVTDGVNTETCTITVDAEGLTPSIVFNNTIRDEESLFIDDMIDLSAKVNFNGRDYTDAVIIYTSSAPNVAEVNGVGVLTAKTLGNTTIVAKTTWRGFEVSKEINVSVTQDATLSISIDNNTVDKITVYAISTTFGDRTYSNEQAFTVEATLNEQDAEYVLTSLNTDIFTVEGDKVVAVKAGSGTLKLALRDDATIFEQFEVIVEKPVLSISEEVELFDATKGKYITVNGATATENTIQDFVSNKVGSTVILDGSTVRAESVETTPVKTETGIAYVNNELKTIPVNGKKMVKQTVIFETDAVIYQVTVCPATNVITSETEFLSIFTGGTSSTPKTSAGYYILAKDIVHDISDYRNCVNHTDTSTDFHDTLTGTLDGNGKKIKDFYLKNGGLFGNMYGTLKNICIDVRIENYRNVRVTILGNFNSNTVVSDAYIKVNSLNKTNALYQLQGLCYKGMSASVTLNNVVIDSTALKFKASSTPTENEWQYYNPYSTIYDIFSTNTGAIKNLSNLQSNQKNVYFITPQYLSEFSLGSGKPHAIIEAGNKREGWTYDSKYTGGIAAGNIETVFIDTFFRYDTAEAMKDATKTGDFTAFTSTGLWSQDSTNGLVWKGKE